MKNIIKIAWRNLFRYTRRTLLTSLLIVVGVTLVVVFGGVGNFFKNEAISTLTNTTMGDMQIHKKGYTSSIDNLPLNLTIPENGTKKIESILNGNPQVKAYSERIRFAAMISNSVQTTNIRLTAIHPEQENQTCQDLIKKIQYGNSNLNTLLEPGSIIIPFNIAKGMNLKIGDDVVVVATNKDGSVNGATLKVFGISENINGPQGKDGYVYIDDAMSLLRIENGEITEIAIKLKNFDKLDKTYLQLKNELSNITGKYGQPLFEIHTWADLSPFASIAKIVTLLIMTVRVFLIFIVLISILDVMMMSVYERVGEIGTIASLGTSPSKILTLFLTEGLSLGFISAIVGGILGTVLLSIISAIKLNFKFGMMRFSLTPQIPIGEVAIILIIVILISTLASLQPALKASKMEPVEALRHV